MQQCILELVGSPAVLIIRVSNLPLRVVRSLFISINKGGIVMDKVSGKLTVYFDEPFWVGVFERVEDGKLSVSKVTFGAEPKDYEVYDFILRHYFSLQFSPAVATAVKETIRNPKKRQKDVEKQLRGTGIGTKSQQALKLQQEQNKQERKAKSREWKMAEAKRMFELKQQKKKEKHRGR